jgi:hypothetical protein
MMVLVRILIGSIRYPQNRSFALAKPSKVYEDTGAAQHSLALDQTLI